MRKRLSFAVFWSAITRSLTATRKSKGFVSCLRIVFIIVATLSMNSANAKLATTLSGTTITVTPKIRYAPTTICDITFSYEQFMVIDGNAGWVATEFEYAAGRRDFILESTCDGYNILALSTCACLTDEIKNSTKVAEEENTTTEIAQNKRIELTTASKQNNPIWLREKKTYTTNYRRP